MNELIDGLKVVLGTTFQLYMKTHAAHWNVEGSHFFELHRMLQTQYEDIWASVDDIAEQIRQLDAYAPSTLERLIELSHIPSDATMHAPREMLMGLLAGHEAVILIMTEALHLAENADRQGLVNFLAARLEAHSKHRWMLRATVKRL